MRWHTLAVPSYQAEVSLRVSTSKYAWPRPLTFFSWLLPVYVFVSRSATTIRTLFQTNTEESFLSIIQLQRNMHLTVDIAIATKYKFHPNTPYRYHRSKVEEASASAFRGVLTISSVSVCVHPRVLASCVYRCMNAPDIDSVWLHQMLAFLDGLVKSESSRWQRSPRGIN